MMAAIHQPHFLPWLGFFHKALQVDVLVLYDDILFPNSTTFENHTYIKTQAGRQCLTLPLHAPGGCLFHQVCLARVNWPKTLRTIQYAYQRAPFFQDYFPGLTDICVGGRTELGALNGRLIGWLLQLLGGGASLVRSSNLGLPLGLSGEEHVLAILRRLGAARYLSGTGTGSKRHIREEDFIKEGIELVWQKFDHPVYPQLHGEFLPGLSVLDLLMNCGPRSREILMGEHRAQD